MKLTDNELKILLKFVYCEVAYTKREKTIHPSYKASLARLKKKLETELDEKVSNNA